MKIDLTSVNQQYLSHVRDIASLMLGISPELVDLYRAGDGYSRL